MPQQTHIQQQQQKAEAVKQRVITLLGWTDLQYGEFQMKIGRQYLQSYIPRDPDGIDELLKNRIFWNWWRNHWMMRDEQFLVAEMIQDKLRLYTALHNPEFLTKEIYPNGHVLAAAYSKMIGDVIDEPQNQLP